MNNKIKAFTIMEVTVAMVLAAISIAIVYAAFTVINKLYRGYDIKNKQLSELVLVDKLLKKDFSEARMVVRSENGFVARYDSALVFYEFNPDFILRSQDDLHSDTIKLINNGLVFLFEQEEAPREGIIDKLKFTAIMDGRKVNLLYHKVYSADELHSDN